jgi:endoribonuclease LACTB2
MLSSVKQAACVVLLRHRKSGGYEVFLARRSPKLRFLGGFDVFPGGTQDAADLHYAEQFTNPPASPHQISALRELFEETGVLASHGKTPIEAATLKRFRQALLAGTRSASEDFFNALDAVGHSLACQDLFPMGFWRTPPYTPTIFEAYYYGLWLPSGQKAEIWPGELMEGQWYRPQDALALHHAGRLFISFPVLETLRALDAQKQSPEDIGRHLSCRAKTYPHAGGEILRGVHVCPLKTFTLPPATHTNCYILGEAELAVVDPGTPIEEEQQKLLEFLDHLQNKGGKVTQIWLSHEHKDHIGAVEILQKKMGLRLYAHAETAKRLPPNLKVEKTIQDKDVLSLAGHAGQSWHWEALHTPGHARGHLCFQEKGTQTLLSGDHVLGLGTVLVSPPLGHMGDYIQSLRRLRARPISFMLPAHGPPIATAHDKIDFYIEHRLARETAIFERMQDTPLRAKDLVAQIYHDTDPRAWPLAEINIQAHLEKLQEEGKIKSCAKGYFRA